VHSYLYQSDQISRSW